MFGQHKLLPPIIIIALFVSALFAIANHNYYRESEFLTYRLIENLQNGNGLIYNTGDTTLVTLNPVFPAVLSLFPFDPHHTAAIIFALSLAAMASTLFYILQNTTHLTVVQSTVVITTVLVSWPIWSDFRASSPLSFLLIMIAFQQTQRGKWALGAQITVLATLMNVSMLIPGIMLGTYAILHNKTIKFWLSGCSSYLIVSLLATIMYDDVLILSVDTAFLWQDGIWLLFFVLATYVINRAEQQAFWIVPLWAMMAIFLQYLLTGQLNLSGNIALALTVGIAIAISLPQTTGANSIKAAPLSIPLFLAILLILTPPQTTPELSQEIQISQNLDLSPTGSIVHPHSDSLPYFVDNFRGKSYRFDGGYDRQFRDMVTRGDTQSMLIALAPDYILLADGNMDQYPRLTVLDYSLSNESQLYTRNQAVTPMIPLSDDAIILNPDVTLAGYAVDRTRPGGNDTIRIRLHWQLNRLPEEPVGININLLRSDGLPVASAFPILDEQIWQNEALDTYHAIQLNSDVEPGLLTLQITVEYRAGVIGSESLTTLVSPFSTDTDNENPISTLGPIQLSNKTITATEGRLHIGTVWSVSEMVSDDYAIFMHLTPEGSPVPVSQADGPPANGRLPTSYWISDESVVDERNISLTDIPAGTYQVRAGFYLPDGTRITSGERDAIQLATVTIETTGNVQISEIND